MKRVLISQIAFKLSGPGVDVDQASGSGLIFDGFGGYAYNGVYVAGLFASSGMVNKGPFYQGVVNFGKTFDSPPQCIVRILDINHQNARASSYLGTVGQTGQGVGPLQIFVTTMSLTVNLYYSGNYYPAQVGFSYVALQI